MHCVVNIKFCFEMLKVIVGRTYSYRCACVIRRFQIKFSGYQVLRLQLLVDWKIGRSRISQWVCSFFEPAVEL